MSGLKILQIEDRPWQSDRSSWFVLQMLVFCGSLKKKRLENYLYMSYCSYFSEVYIKLFIFSLQGFRKKGNFSSQMIPNQQGGRKIDNVGWESCSQALEETRRNQDPG